ncbi:hypothetical protein [Stenotrophomonas sp. Sm5341]|uniref:hypothetical protein n=1 Tax=Stenotrophomonas sp. Sm5341 TaxID=3002750 RepID=UPI0027E4FB9E|nr:hypothetical protein [Stenotrophomonas sp. Sm5341]MDQ7284911.1 hypothetical protein [Stenotrophomonas sp. Sm5341]
MSKGNKTLADVQPGGRVMLGNQAERARFEEFLSRNPLTALCAGTAWEVWKAALSAQPSPGGQGELAALVSKWRNEASAYDDQQAKETGFEVDWTYDAKARALDRAADELESALAARQPVALIAQKVGDYRVTVAEDAITVSRGRDIVFAYSAGDAEPINASQPVGQIVGYMDPNADFMLARPGDCVLMGNIVLWREPGSKYTKPLYDAPPAKAVDLGRWSQRHADDLHVAVHTALSVHAGSLSQKKRAAISAYVKRLLIDSQAVGK